MRFMACSRFVRFYRRSATWTNRRAISGQLFNEQLYDDRNTAGGLVYSPDPNMCYVLAHQFRQIIGVFRGCPRFKIERDANI